jgi:DNA-binding MarR family transcriptional regulator
MAEKRKFDNNSDGGSNKKQAHETHSFETKLHILKHIDNGEGHGEITRLLGLSHSTVSITLKNIVKITEHVKSAGSLRSIMVNAKQRVMIEEMEHLLKIWLDDQAQRHISVSKAIISAKVKSLEEKKVAVQLKLDKFFTKQPVRY